MVYDYFAKRKIDVERSKISEVATELFYIIQDLEFKKKNSKKEELSLIEGTLKERALAGLAADCLLGSKYYQKNKS